MEEVPVGINEANELEGDLRKRVGKLRDWLLDFMPAEVLEQECIDAGRKLRWYEANQRYITLLRRQTVDSAKWLDEKQAKIDELKKFVSDVLVAVPLDDFARGKDLLGLGPADEPLRPTSADDAFREASIRAQGHAHDALPHERSKLWIAMMDAIARKQGAESTAKVADAAIRSLELQEKLALKELDVKTDARAALDRMTDEEFARRTKDVLDRNELNVQDSIRKDSTNLADEDQPF